MSEADAQLRLRVPFVEKAEIELKKIGLELVVRVGTHKRNIILPAAMAPYRPREAKFSDEALTIGFTREEHAGRAEANGRSATTATHQKV